VTSFSFSGGKRTRNKSTELSPGCGCAISALFFFAGLFAFVLMVRQFVLPLWRAKTVYVEHTCIILDKRIGESHGDGSSTYRPEFFILYTVDGQEYRIWAYDAGRLYSSGRSGKQAVLDQFQIGQTYPCWYDPDDPGQSVLVRDFDWMLLFLLLPIIFMLIGGAGMIACWSRRGKSREQVASVKSAAAGANTVPYPGVPELDLTDHPGTQLALRLPIQSSPGGQVFFYLIFGLFWNGVTSVFVYQMIQGHLQGNPDWCLTVFICPFVLIGLGVIVLFVRQLLITLGIGPTVVEIATHPLHPGQSCQLYFAQTGRLRLNSLRVLLVCEEVAKYRQGTDTRTETKRVHETELFHQEEFEISPDFPCEVHKTFVVPANAMHSFQATNNEVQWKILVSGNVVRWPNYERDYTIVVRPSLPQGAT
jgi:hypothetical protein